MRIATYNANSIRSRLDTITRWLSEQKPDVLAIQETKVQDSEFPVIELMKTGYKVCFRGQLKNNGVAMLSRQKPDNVIFRLEGDDKDEARFIKASFGKVTVINTYIPQGFEIQSERFQYKLDWFKWLRQHLEKYHTPDELIIWAGDFNAALEDIDVYNPARLWGTVCYCQPAKDALLNVMDWGFVDLFRSRHPEGGNYTFWDYRFPNVVIKNLGWRLDYVMATRPAAKVCIDCWIDRQPRTWDKPSDHTFVVADFDSEKM